MPQYHIAQFNIAKMRAPIEDDLMAGFVSRLDEINLLAEATPGFVWRLQSENGDSTSIRVYGDDTLLVNFSVWESIETLHEYTYKSAHVEVFRNRNEWFKKFERPHLVMWWIAAGHIPTTAEATAKLDYLLEHGPSPLAFTFAKRFSVADMLAVKTG